jgi:hypothetical protein
VFLAEILKNRFQSVAIIGMAKNTGKTYTFNQLVMEGRKLGLQLALTSIGLDGEERDSLYLHKKPRIMVYPGMITANAKALLVSSGLDYEVLGATGVGTPLGEVVLSRILSAGRTILAGPGSVQGLAAVKRRLEAMDVDLLLVDGAVDRRSFSASVVTDTAVLAVGAEVAWDRTLLLEKLRHYLAVLTLPGLTDPAVAQLCKEAPEDAKLMVLTADGCAYSVRSEEFFQQGGFLDRPEFKNAKLVYVKGMLTDAVLTKIWGSAARPASFTLAASDPTSVFLGPRSLAKLAAQGVALRVVDSLHLSAVTVNPFNSRYGYAEPVQLLQDVGRAVYPLPCFDLRLGLRYQPE